jgi:polyhydroxyalkanoate synthesis regulator phasin
LEDKITIFDGELSLLYTFSETASFIFSKIKLGWEKNKLIDALVKKYGISGKKAEKDVEEFMQELRCKKIV